MFIIEVDAEELTEALYGSIFSHDLPESDDTGDEVR
jgi:hypothetical protein